LGFTSRRNSNSLWTVDQYGTITQMVIPQNLRDVSNRSSTIVQSFYKNGQLIQEGKNPFEIPAEKPSGAFYGQSAKSSQQFRPTDHMRRLGPSMSNLNGPAYTPSRATPVRGSSRTPTRVAGGYPTSSSYINKENYTLTPTRSLSGMPYPVVGQQQTPTVVRRLDQSPNYMAAGGPPIHHTITKGNVQPSIRHPPRQIMHQTGSYYPNSTLISQKPLNQARQYVNQPYRPPSRSRDIGSSPEVIRSSYGAYPTKTRVQGGVPGGLTKIPIRIEKADGVHHQTKNMNIREPYQTKSFADLFRSRRTALMNSRRSTNFLPKDPNSNYLSINGKARTFDSKRIYDPIHSPQYNTHQKSYLKKTSKRNQPKINSFHNGSKEDNGGSFPWEKNPLEDKTDDDIHLRELGTHSPSFNNLSPLRTTHNSLVSKGKIITSPQPKSALGRLIYAIQHPEVYQTGFDSCINIIPILPEFGYVNCATHENRLAQYEIDKNGKIRQTEILKSKAKILTFFLNSWSIL